MILTKEEKKAEDLVNEKYDVLIDTYAFLVDMDERGFYIKYCHEEEIAVVGKIGESIEILVNEAYNNHLKIKS
jgi:hypothetical protein